MKSFRRPSLFKKILFSYFGIFVLLAIAIFSVKSTWNIYSDLKQTEARKEQLEQDILAIKTREKELRENIEELKTDKGTQEEIMRKFNVAKEDEEVVIILEKKPELISEDPMVKETSFWDLIFFWR